TPSEPSRPRPRADEEDEKPSTSPQRFGPARPGRFRAPRPRAAALPAALQSRISRLAHSAPTRFSRRKECAAVPYQRAPAGSRPESGTGLAVYRLVHWLPRIGGLGQGDRKLREEMVAGMAVAVGKRQDAALRVHARSGAGLEGRRGGARAAHACA